MMRRITFDNSQKRDEVVEKALRNKLIVIGAGKTAIRLMPPVNIPLDYLKWGLEVLKRVMN